MKKVATILILMVLCTDYAFSQKHFSPSGSAGSKKSINTLKSQNRTSGLSSKSAHKGGSKEAAYQNICLQIAQKYQDSLLKLRLEADSLLDCIPIIANNTPKLLENPYYYKLFVSPMLYKDALKQQMDINYSFGQTIERPQLHLFGEDSVSRYGAFQTIGGALPEFRDTAQAPAAPLLLSEQINNIFADMYVRYPNLVMGTDDALEREKPIRTDIDIIGEQPYQTTISEKVKPKNVEDVVEPIVAISRKPNFWKFTGKVSLKMMQNYYSDNWYQGGTNYNSALWKSFFTMNYNNKEKFHWDNSLEFNLGFQTDRNDKKHKYKTNNDLLRIINSVGLQASGCWYYSASLTSWTQVYPKFNNNSDYVYSDFFSPFESVLSLGMEYKKSRKNWNINVKPSPLSYDFKYVGRKKLYQRYGVKGNKHTQEKIGSALTCTFNWQVLKELHWKSYLYCYTNYKSSLVQWENTFNFRINKYLSTELFVNPRFDDSYHSSKSDAKIQLKEYLSLGFDYNF